MCVHNGRNKRIRNSSDAFRQLGAGGTQLVSGNAGPMQGKERRVRSSPRLNTPRALFPGRYNVFVHVSVATKDKDLGEATVKPGQKTTLKH
jgi:hypothetical protein